MQDVLRHANSANTQICTYMAREELRKKLARPFAEDRPEQST